MPTAQDSTIFADKALLPTGWAENVRVDFLADGEISAVETNALSPVGETHRVGILLPAPSNLHSHAFQRAMAGMSERRGQESRDSFWTWRQIMFRFLDTLAPDDVEAIAAFVQMEMLGSRICRCRRVSLSPSPAGRCALRQPCGNVRADCGSSQRERYRFDLVAGALHPWRLRQAPARAGTNPLWQ
jgi:hypothetical protein